ncbi:Glu-tRNA(Gln) amidotransferase subunit GatE [Haloferax volcanii]|uniref:Glutamyl-tRNA(Gln) amidotransferase subunit E n=3 Tax=Haloferax volcanii TaxID=2246 RepID=D4GXP9_HALVD|nr:Glu-tRNA(Gln) amidotransferase subunit GatE [Haloferax volcanii]ADE02379.1 glutamyl-tRNA(Gln) amidotransferase subunit E [Haloferax volcanii DS2]ELY24513.1 glutamyl-tRNA(Gln) amidotransferase subunit E [Haloferax volcanii DS2]MBS8120715.1 Glu-tRNA(Gln) amidotransferase subunit GatE [Haloferax volcanii]MBS8125752.1 Glu-tRNA(Gln) amidotransferase subunit GatE [Haloferax volcanii]MBS8129536.1 Glu-tRNA(Gln) amidotransferase subunit GatE [Haloferax volcanii]
MTEYDYDYEDLGLVAGLEIHQQLDTETKLFCGCPTDLREPDEATRTFTRFLHPTKSELGELDDAALEESRVEREFEYLAYDSTCLVEEDDEPPHELDHEARTVAMQIAELLDMNVVDEAHVMRKLVIDGSNTSGFQRSSLIAQEGEIQTEDGPVSVVDLMLEEESAQRVEERDDGVLYSLDRLGIPLVEIGTGPDISSPEQAREAAQTIGMLLRSTGKVKRGLGTIRQDVNVSIADGARVEIKGVQALDQIDEIVRFEVGRQAELVEIRDELQSRDASVGGVADVTDVFEDSDSGVIRGALDAGGKVTAVPLYGFDGLVGRELQPDRRLGTELSDHAKRHGAGGIFHTDELPAYGVTEAEVESLREAVDAGPEDAVAIVADDPETADLAIDAVAERAEVAIEEVPEETRGANDDGTTRYLRPLPGAARMYPETDVPPVDLDPSDVETPELLTEKVDRYQAEFGLDAGLAEQVAYGRTMPLFEEAVDAGIDATFAAGLLESTLTELRRDDVAVSELTDDHLLAVMQLVEDGDLAKEGVNDVLTTIAEDPSLTAEEAVEEAGLSGVSEEEVREAIAEVVERNADQVEQQGMGAFSALMGEAMGALRGKADGGVVSDVLREEIQKRA